VCVGAFLLCHKSLLTFLLADVGGMGYDSRQKFVATFPNFGHGSV
jgi:hypothetical protein